MSTTAADEYWFYKHRRLALPWLLVLGSVLGAVSGAVTIARLAPLLKVLLFAGALLSGVGYLYGRVRSTWPWYWYAAGHAWSCYAVVCFAWGIPDTKAGMPLEERIFLLVTWGFLIWLAESIACIFAGGLFCLLRPPVVRHDGSLCSTCGYSLVGNVSGACPECGQASEHTETEPSAADNQL